MKLLTWNTNFCWNKDNPEWMKFTRELIKDDYDLILLQEINPFFVYNIDYEHQKGPKHEFQTNDKYIYYHELYSVLMKERPEDAFWGNAIITKKNIKKLKTYFYNENNEYTGSNYFGYEALMAYDFSLENGKMLTIINHYKKQDAFKAKYDGNGKPTNYDETYCYEDGFFNDIRKFQNNANIIIFAGDFNLTKRKEYDYDKGGIIKKIEDIGFKNITNRIGDTMNYPNQNDFIFINSNYSNSLYDIQKIKPPESIDHFGIECKIKL